MPDVTNITFREPTPGDMDFVLATWKRSWRTCPWAGTVRNDQYYAAIESTIEGLVLRGASFLLAVAPRPDGAGDRILGWVCYELLARGELCVHYLYVKDAFVRLDVGAQLVAQLPGTRPGFYTHRYRQVVQSVSSDWRHAPEIARRK